MKMTSDVESWLALSMIDGLGDESIRKLLGAFDSPAEILSAPAAELERVIKRKAAASLVRGADAEQVAAALKWLENPANSIVTLADADYPPLLLNIADPPPLLYLKGRRELLTFPMLAIVGSRNATPQGLANAEAFAEAASNAGFCVVSGMALGVDAAAHGGGLRGTAASIGVVGTGLDIVYPGRNRSLAHLLAEHGALISEFPLGTPAIGSNFPRRNRIISGMSRGCLVVEAALESGSLITARQALEEGRDVFAVPGSIHSPFSKGCHALIKQGAKLVEAIEDILDEFGYECPARSIRASDGAKEPVVQESVLLNHLGHDISDIDALCAGTGLTVETVSAMLLSLELDGVIASLPGGRYQRLR
ncbi:MAG: DNA-processing protein DprA [Nitrosospira sp.]|jgi:DNA processing protein|nr:DNA-processing protein DprA [Nitrosospira sp.]